MVYLSSAALKASAFRILISAIKAAKGVDTFKGNSPFTIFVPTDETFAELQANTHKCTI
ncbi:MAG: fasciclin domain-containing protein [Nostoc sp. JL34]|uniref:fasciclin domain-containing protein n=1 Tax=Nostoc sp. JL34 TaxID=2815397 RepID=UPI001D788987|nr:fasciclin domain-containing protein [Nostoc sp. JL34]